MRLLGHVILSLVTSALHSASKNRTGTSYLTFSAKKAFNLLRYVFAQAFIHQHFNLERHIQIKTNMSGYNIGEILNQLTLDNFGQWLSIAYYLHKMILAKT